MGEAIGLDFNAVKIVMDLYLVDNQRQMLEDLDKCFVWSEEVLKKKRDGINSNG